MTNDENPTIRDYPQRQPSRLSVCILASTQLIDYIKQALPEERYITNFFNAEGKFLEFVEQNHQQIDCLILSHGHSSLDLFRSLYKNEALLPAVIIESNTSSDYGSYSPLTRENDEQNQSSYLYHYHTAEIRLPEAQKLQIAFYIDQALTKFIKLSPHLSLPGDYTNINDAQSQKNQDFVLGQKQRLIDKLKERLGYLGVYYKRKPQQFFRNLSGQERQELMDQLTREYRQIILNYFSKGTKINQAIDRFVNDAFFADLSVSQIVEIHMELMDDFAQQLKLEGRNEDILIDYRLTLIDIIAHLCEMYRRSIPREDLSLDSEI